MATVTLSLFAGVGQQFFDNSGNPLTGGKIYSYEAGTTTPAVTYTTVSGTSSHANPIVLDAAGRVPSGGEIWLPVNVAYKFVVNTSAGALLATYDNVPTAPNPPITNDASSIAYEPGWITTAGDFVVGQTYQIAVVGSTDFTLIGATVNAVGTHFIATGVGSGSGSAYLTTTVQTKLQQTVSVFDFMTAAQIADVKAGTLLLDTLPAFEAAIASFPTTFDSTYYSYGGTIYVPSGKYYLSDTLNIERQIRLIGADSPDGNAIGSTQMVFADGKNGIEVHEYRTSSSGKGADGTEIKDLYLTRKNSVSTSGHGIYLHAEARLRSCLINGFAEDGIHIEATSGSSPNGNVNRWQIDSCRSMNNAANGLYVNGADVNAGVAIRLDCSGNTEWGVFDSSFLGNTYVGCHTASNGAGAYKTDDANARNVFLGCYSEGDQPTSNFVYPSFILGGLHSAGISGSGLSIVDGVVSSRFRWYQDGDSTSPFYFDVADSGPSLFALNSAGYPWRLKGKVGSFFFDAANDNAARLAFYTSQASTANGYARNVYAELGECMGMPRGYVAGSNLNSVLWDTAAPGSGTHSQGDVIYNQSPSAGGHIGWVCVAGGTPGTWKTFGAISA